MKKTKTGFLLRPDEIQAIQTSFELNRRIAKGEVLIISIYRSMDYCPKVRVLTVDWEGMLCKILEGKENGEIQYYRTDAWRIAEANPEKES